MPDFQVLYWRDIPAQVRVFNGRRPLSKQLPARFQVLIDRVAMDEGLAGTDDYLDQWQWTEKQSRHGDPAELVETLVEELVAAYDEKTRQGDSPGP
jgi:hypothetical protein